MKVNTTARHCELDPEVRLFAQQRLEKLMRYFRDPRDLMEAHVVVSAEKYRHAAEITLKLRRGEVVGREQADDPRAAIELATERLEHQIRKIKERRLERQRGGHVREIVLPAREGETSDDEMMESYFDESPAETGNGGPAGGAPKEE